jgi:hypothetical protein
MELKSFVKVKLKNKYVENRFYIKQALSRGKFRRGLFLRDYARDFRLSFRCGVVHSGEQIIRDRLGLALRSVGECALKKFDGVLVLDVVAVAAAAQLVEKAVN